MALLDVDIDRREGSVRLALRGELDIASARRVEEELDAIRSEGPDLLVLDLRELAFMDSTGLRLIVRADEAARGSGTRLAIVRGPETVHRVFQIVGLDGRLPFVDEPPAP